MSTNKVEEHIMAKRLWARLKKTDRQLLVGLLIVLILALLATALLPRFIFSEIDLVEDEIVDSNESLYRNPLTGVVVSEPVEELPQVFGVMIDNHFDAWPPAGIDKAFLVVEAPVEGGISRMLTFFEQDQDIEKIGPVRSARPYYLDWNNELDAAYVHVGGSNAALDLIASGGTFDMNQYWWGQYFWRANGNRFAPHNVFTSSDLLSDFVDVRAGQGVEPDRLYGVWKFKDIDLSTEGTYSSLSIDYSAPVYVVGWEYVEETGLYERSQYNQPHATESGQQITASNVAVIITDVSVIDNVGRRKVRTIGEGEGFVLQDGNVITVRWNKPSATERLRFYHEDSDEEVVMNAGVTWIEVVPSEDDITIE
jgi:hypothetical protein